MANVKKKTTTKTTKSKVATIKKTKPTKSSETTSVKKLERFSVPMVEVKPINAANIKYNYAYKNDLINQQKNQSINDFKNQVNQIEKLDQKMIDELNIKINDLNEKNKQWQSKYDHLNSEYQAYKKNIELEKLNNCANNCEDNNQCNNPNNEENTKHSFWNRKKDKNNENTNNENSYQNETNEQLLKDFELQKQNWENLKKQLEEQIRTLNLQLDNERKKMVDKIQEKALEAQKLVEEKVAKIEADKSIDIMNNKLKVFESTINCFLDPYIIFKNTLNSINNPQVNGYLQGFRMIADMIKDNLINLGVEEIAVNIGDQFDENYMVAFDVVEDGNFQHNQVVKIVNSGYVFTYNDQHKILKFVSVIVAK